MTQETRLFKYRLHSLSESDVNNYLATECKIKYESCSESDPVWIKLKEDICFQARSDKDKLPNQYVKVPFKEATALISRRQVFVYMGIAYVPIRELYEIASVHFKTKLL
jgi:hypothetical protein